jgi:hypothetical protein
MTRTELKERLEKLEHERFLMDMIDRWLPCDWERVNNLNREIVETKKMLATA